MGISVKAKVFWSEKQRAFCCLKEKPRKGITASKGEIAFLQSRGIKERAKRKKKGEERMEILSIDTLDIE